MLEASLQIGFLGNEMNKNIMTLKLYPKCPKYSATWLKSGNYIKIQKILNCFSYSVSRQVSYCTQLQKQKLHMINKKLLLIVVTS